MNYKIEDELYQTGKLATSAVEYSTIQEQVERMAEYQSQKDAAIFATAKESIAQRKLLELQLSEVKEQNSQLKENYNLLKELYEAAKNDAIESKKEAKRSRIFGWVSFGVGALLSVIGIVVGAII